MQMTDFRLPEAYEANRAAHVEIDSTFIKAYRRQAKESQKFFWSRFGVTQSRGSRFELGANIPKPVTILLKLYFNGLVTDDNISHVSQKRPPAGWAPAVNQDRSIPYVSP